MVLEMLIEFMEGFTHLNTVLLLAAFLVFIALAYKVFQALVKAFIVGVIAATFPVAANMMGMDVAITVHNVIWFAIFGVVGYLLYATISGGARIIGLALSPFRRLFSRKPVQKVIIKEKEKKD